MISLTVLENTRHSILYEIPPGKPNPMQECTINGDARERVLQSSQKGATCWYYTFNFLRKRIGKNPCEEMQWERKIEKLCSSRRKEQTAYDEILPIRVADVYLNSEMKLLESINRENASSFLNQLVSFSFQENLEESSLLIDCIKEFIIENKDDNLYKFLTYKRAIKSIEINKKFLHQFSDKIDTLEKEILNKFDIEQQAAIFDTYVRDFSSKLYHLKKSCWCPSQGIDCLIKELKTNGPLMVLGVFGHPSYVEEPFKMSRKISERDIYAWRPGAKRCESIQAHSVLLVGAKKTQDNAFAYFIDPSNPSDPADKNKQKIYMLSFTNLTSHIFSLTGQKINNADDIGYAYYGNFNPHLE